MAINKISEFPKVTPSADDKILIEKNGEGGYINLSEMPVSTPVEKKISDVQKDLNDRITALAFEPGDTTGDAELKDIRKPATGFTVPANVNAGGAVRAQVTQLDGKINELKGDLDVVNNGNSYIPDWKIIKNEYVQYNGTISPYEGWDRTDYFEVEPNETLYYYSQANLTYVNFYDANKNPISLSTSTTILASGSEYTVPNNSNIKYWIISGSASDMSVFKIWRKSAVLDDATISRKKTYSSDKIEKLLLPYTKLKPNIVNRFDMNTISEGKYLNTSLGVLESNSDFFASDYIDIHDIADRVMCSYTHIVCFYDDGKNFISGQSFNTNSADAYVDKPSNAYYLRFSNYNNHIPTSQIGEYVSRKDYVPYGMYTLDGLMLTSKPIVVDVNGNGNYTSLTRALYENVDSGDDIVVKAGTYNIVSEYVELFGQTDVDNMADADGAIFNGFQYGAIIRNRKITFEAGSHIVCDWTGHTVDGTHRFSALRVDYNAEIIGLDLVATATFYAIHDDYGINAPYTVKYENCRVKGINLYNANCIGGGCKSYSRHILKNCYFDNGLMGSATVRYHNTNAEGAEAEIYVSNSYFNNALKFNYYGSQTSKMRAYVNSCEAKSIVKDQESASYSIDNIELYKWNNKETN